jgi:hypothetical protein
MYPESGVLTNIAENGYITALQKRGLAIKVRGDQVDKIKKCAACRYCRVHTAIKTGAVLLAGSIISIVVLFDSGI